MAIHAHICDTDFKQRWIWMNSPSVRKLRPLRGPEVQIFSLCIVSHTLESECGSDNSDIHAEMSVSAFVFLFIYRLHTQLRAPRFLFSCWGFGWILSRRWFLAGLSLLTGGFLVHLSKARSRLEGGEEKKNYHLLSLKFALATISAQTVVGCHQPIKQSVEHQHKHSSPY